MYKAIRQYVWSDILIEHSRSYISTQNTDWRKYLIYPCQHKAEGKKKKRVYINPIKLLGLSVEFTAIFLLMLIKEIHEHLHYISMKLKNPLWLQLLIVKICWFSNHKGLFYSHDFEVWYLFYSGFINIFCRFNYALHSEFSC